MRVAMIAFNEFTDADLFLPWDLFHRVRDPYYAAYKGAWECAICADTPTITSYSGLTIDRQQPLEWARGADGVFIVSGNGSRSRLNDPAWMAKLALDPARQTIAAIDSGVLILAATGLLDGLSATTYPSVFAELERMGVRTERRAMVVHGAIATGGGCLATQDLAGWMVERLIGEAPARAIVDSVARVEA